VVLVISYFIYQNNQQLPEVKDVLKITDDWSIPIDVLTIEKIDGEWITFFRDSEQMYVGFLQQNWLGQWNLKDSLGNEGVIGEVTLHPNPQERNGIVWGASGLSKGGEPLFSYFYGMISNSEIDTVTLSVDNEEPRNVSFIESNGERFFFIKTDRENAVPYKFQAIFDGKVIATES
jgi:hypothetical protein